MRGGVDRPHRLHFSKAKGRPDHGRPIFKNPSSYWPAAERGLVVEDNLKCELLHSRSADWNVAERSAPHFVGAINVAQIDNHGLHHDAFQAG